MHREFVRDVENGDTAVLFIHGILGSPDHFLRLAAAVPEDIAIHGILLPGHGGKVADFSKSSMTKWREYAFSCADRLCEKYANVIIVAHSMGTLFAIEYAIAHPNRIKSMLLMMCPLKMWYSLTAIKTALAIAFDKVSKNNVKALASKRAYSIEPNKNLLLYLPWIPRHMSLFTEARKVRNKVCALNVPCVVFQSDKDELVSKKTYSYLHDVPCMEVYSLKNSTHNYYTDDDFAMMQSQLLKMIQ